MGLSLFLNSKSIALLEVGFGTGLNALLTLMYAEKNNLFVNYEALEAYPLKNNELQSINFPEQLQLDRKLFDHLHQVEWELTQQVTPNFSLKKRNQFVHQFSDIDRFDLIYFDAFGPRVQPELWSAEIFKLMFQALKPKGVLVTYSSNSNARRAMQEVGFLVEKLPGPPGKREMLRAMKS